MGFSVSVTWERHMAAEIDLDTAEGFQQIYGGMEPDGTVGRGVFFAVQNPGDAARLTLWLERLPVDSGLYPLSLWIDVGVGDVVSVAVPEPVEGSRAIVDLDAILPEEVRQQPWIDIQLRAEHLWWGLIISANLGGNGTPIEEHLLCHRAPRPPRIHRTKDRMGRVPRGGRTGARDPTGPGPWISPRRHRPRPLLRDRAGRLRWTGT